MPGTAEILKEFKHSPVRKLAALLDVVKNDKELISLGGGSPSLPPPPELSRQIASMMTESPHKIATYTGTRGMPEVREAIAADIQRDSGVWIDPSEEIILTSGATEGIMAALMAILNEEDEVIVMNPTYLGYPEAIKLARGRIKDVPVNVTTGFQPDVERVKNAISRKTKALVLLSPDNPTGRIVEREVAKAIIDLANDHDFWVVVDEAYNHMVYDGEKYWVNALNGARERAIVCSTFSKTASIPGFRLGYVTGPAHVINGMENITQYLSLCPGTVGQYAALMFLQGETKYSYLNNTVLPTYRERRDAMGKYLAEFIPFGKTVKPRGAFFYFVEMSHYLNKLGMNDETFALALMNEAKVVVIPGIHFGSNGANHVRLTFVSEPPNRIQEGFRRIAAFISKKNAA